VSAWFGATSRFVAWWHRDESRGSLVYRQRLSDPVGVFVAVFLVASFFRFQPRLLIEVIVSLVSLDCVLSLRRAIILTAGCVIYRPPLGEPTSIPLSGIISVTEVRTVGTLTFIGGFARGVRISTNRGSEVFQLTVQNSNDLVGRLRNISACISPGAGPA
jgi:hypothetical protein